MESRKWSLLGGKEEEDSVFRIHVFMIDVLAFILECEAAQDTSFMSEPISPQFKYVGFVFVSGSLKFSGRF